MELIKENIIALSIAPEILWIFLAIGIVVLLVMIFIFKHHWNYYGIEGNQKVFAKSLFLIISIFLIVVMTLSILIFETI